MQKIATKKELKQKKCIVVNGKDLALFCINDKYYCIDNTCPHVGGPLCEGDLSGFNISCPWHGSEFDVRDGHVLKPPAPTPVKTYKVIIKGEDIYADI